MTKTECRMTTNEIPCLEHWNICILDLFRVSNFVLRISSLSGLGSHGPKRSGLAPCPKWRYLRLCDGFTLIETLVAMAILSISLVVILQLFSGGLKSSRLSDNYTRAIFHAREKMEEILLDDNFTDMAMEGEFGDGFEWKAQTLRLEPAQEEEAKLPVDIFSIKVDVSWHEGSQEKHFEISTLKIAEKAES